MQLSGFANHIVSPRGIIMFDDEPMQLHSEAANALLSLKTAEEVTKAFPRDSEMLEIWLIGQDDPAEGHARLMDFNKPSL